MKLGTLRKFDNAAITQIPRDQVRLLWSDDWYDGPISGMAEVQGARYFFEMIDPDALGEEEEHRKYWLIELNADQLNEEEQWHELFCRKVGTHFDFTARPALPEEQVDLAAFYGPYRERKTPDYGNNTFIGWFEL